MDKIMLEVNIDKLRLKTEKESANIYINERGFDINHHTNGGINVSSSHNVSDGEKNICIRIGSNKIYVKDLDVLKSLKSEIESGIEFFEREGYFPNPNKQV